MNRRNVLQTALGAAAALSATGKGRAASSAARRPTAAGKFQLHYAPSFGQFKAHAGDDLTAQIQFAADEGFTAMFDNGIMGRPVADQERIARELDKRGMLLGPFVLYADFPKKSFVFKDPEIRAMLLDKMRQGLETMKRINCRWAL
ncbi:MAG: xylose isomerase, partial [Candidatus Aminicenantales bacterium]